MGIYSKDGFPLLEDDEGDNGCLDLENRPCKKIKRTPNDSSQKATMPDFLMASPLLGLNLRKSPSFENLIAIKISGGKYPDTDTNPNINTSSKFSKFEDVGPQPVSEKLKASNFPVSSISIGTWQRVSRNEGDLVAKCYFAKKKLVWELLNNGLKSKIEIQWADILAIRAEIHENQPGSLKIELNQPPSFYHELDPQPRKHTQWRLVTDFTGGQASLCRRHFLQFPPRALDRHYEKLMQCDSHLFQRSRIPFPSLQSPYFDFNIDNRMINHPFHLRDQTPELNPAFHFSCTNHRALMPLSHHQQRSEFCQVPLLHVKNGTSPTSVMEISSIDEETNNMMMIQGLHTQPCSTGTGTDSLLGGQVDMPEPAAAALQANQPSIHHPSNDDLLRFVHSASMFSRSYHHDTRALKELENHLLEDDTPQVIYPDEKLNLDGVQSWGALTKCCLSDAHDTNTTDGFYDQNSIMQVQMNKFPAYPAVGDFSSVDKVNHIHDWNVPGNEYSCSNDENGQSIAVGCCSLCSVSKTV